eukprot:CAMPEP_0172300662 /NCGR_PEP_ID=MMETSP1058-20130122/2687_1 /TAXON_ID=83371 /ORGANISM="Detonula confervacea, Strain CCMP 353" /LENGTH=230 /DNA_ID=CAMNT_0013010493 /DNA_START=69 /DNA_END=761 /DNA_ORIENTATION=-
MALKQVISVALAFTSCSCNAFTTNGGTASSRTTSQSSSIETSALDAAVGGNLHGESSCFLPLLQNDEDYIAPRIVQIAGQYPGVDVETYLALSSDPSADLGQWSYDFTDPNGPQMGTVALPGMTSVYESDDPVVIIADHISMGVQLTEAITEPVDLIVLCDRSRTNFAERKFLVLELEDSPGVITISAFASKEEMPANPKILGHVMLVQIPWLPSMQKKKSGFMEEDECF